ncbi:MAG: DEAD/DEAH box helicase [Bacteroidota bacterium]
MNFEQLGLSKPILDALSESGYVQPTPIQAQAIPFALKGRDLLACAQTGTGKTAAFLLPILELLSQDLPPRNRRPIRALVLTPTRELAIQIDANLKAYSKFLKIYHTVIFGGVSQVPQVKRISRGIDVMVATPGRLLDLLGQKKVTLDQVEFFVLDEADRMLDMGFIHDVNRLLKLIPDQRQTFFFSATMPPAIVELSKKILHQPAKVEITPPSSTVDMIEQSVFRVTKRNKKNLLKHLLKTEDIETALVFTRTKHGANRVAESLNKAKIPAEAIHGNKSQHARQMALSNFKQRRTRVLVATDIASRGIDVDSLSHVINFDLPNEPETYVHRIGRTGRAGATGVAFSFCDDLEVPYLKAIRKLTQADITLVKEHPFLTLPTNEEKGPSGPGAENKFPPKKKKRRPPRRSKKHRSRNKQVQKA